MSHTFSHLCRHWLGPEEAAQRSVSASGRGAPDTRPTANIRRPQAMAPGQTAAEEKAGFGFGRFAPVALAVLLQTADGDAALRTWDGGSLINNNWSEPDNWNPNTAPSAGDDLLFPPGASWLLNNNDYPAGTTFNSIIFSGSSYNLGGNSIALNAGIAATNSSGGNTLNISSVLNSNQTFTISAAGASVILSSGKTIDTSGKTLTFAGAGLFHVQTLITGSGGVTKVGSGSAFVYGNNTYSGETVLAEGFLSAYHSNALGSTIGGTIVSNETQLTLTAGATFPEPLTLFGTLSSGAGNNTYVGPITLAESNTTLRIELTTPLTVNAVISGSGGFTKTRGGTLTLNSNNTYTGTTTVSEGTVLVNGSQPQSPITITSGTLGGTGTVGTIISSGGTAKTLAPGGSPGILSCSNVTLNSSTTFTVELNGTTPGSGHDQLNVVGAVNLGNCSLNVTLGFTLSGSESFVIINNDESDAVTGTFSGLAEGATFNVGTNQLQITYVGGTGNDVVLFRPSAPPAVINSISVLTNGHAQIQATGLPNLTYGVEAATNLNPVIQWTDLGTAVADGSGEFSFTDTNAPAYPMRFYRVVSP